MACAGERRNLDAIFGSIGEGILTVEPGGIVSAANQAMAAIAGIKRDRIIGQPAATAIDAIIPNFGELLERVRSEGKPLRELCLEFPPPANPAMRTREPTS